MPLSVIVSCLFLIFYTNDNKSAPYGIRAGAKKLGRRKDKVFIPKPNPADNATHIPPTKPYDLDEVVVDLLNFASEKLKIGGRLVFCIPKANDQMRSYLQQPCLTLKSVPFQDLGKWGREFWVFEKTRSANLKQTFSRITLESQSKFRELYFTGFKNNNP